MNNIKFKRRVLENLNDIYSYILSSTEIESLAKKIISLSKNNIISKKKAFSQNDILLITYADSIIDKKEKSFFTLNKFLDNYIKQSFSIIHILPFYPSSSDGGFSVKDFFKVDNQHGMWSDISQLSKNYKIMVDIVINHGSRDSKWFRNFLKNKGEGFSF